MKNLIIVAVFVQALFAPVMRPAAAQSRGVLDPRFGVTEAFWAPEEAVDLRVGWERILFYWREIQPTGPNDWNTLHVREEWLNEATSHGRAVVGLLKNTAPWAAEDGTEAGVPKGLYLPVDDPDNLWATFVRRVASYYSTRNVHNWIIWNEPEIRPGVYGHEFGGTTADYYQLLKVAYKVMKETDPAAVIHLAGLTWWHDQTYLRRLLVLAATDPEASENDHFFDVISLHIYFRSETVKTIVDAVKAIQKEFDINKPIWINETNAAPNRDPFWPVNRPTFQVDLDQQAWYVVQAYSLGFAAGAARIGVYKLLDIHLQAGGESFGLLRPDYTKRPAYEAFKTLTRLLSGFTDVSLRQGADFFVVTFVRPHGVTRVLWTRTPSPVTVQLPALSPVATLSSLEGVLGQVQSREGAYVLELAGARCHGECIIGGAPLFLVEEAVTLGETSAPTASSVDGQQIPPSALVTTTPRPTATASPTATPTATSTSTPSPTRTEIPRKTPNVTPTNSEVASRLPKPFVTPSLISPALANAQVSIPADANSSEAQVLPESTSPEPGLANMRLTVALGVAVTMGLTAVVLVMLWRRVKDGRQE